MKPTWIKYRDWEYIDQDIKDMFSEDDPPWMSSDILLMQLIKELKSKVEQ